jgi:hypothetical protein
MAAPQRFSLNAIPGQIAALEQRIVRIEASLNLILERLSLPTIENPVPIPSSLVPPKVVQPPQKPAEELKSGSYVYKPLENAQIRVLVLNSSGDDTEPVTGKMVHLPLDDDQHGAFRSAGGSMFKALSYTWGDPHKTCSIRIDGHDFPVTANLEAALRHVRNLHKNAIQSRLSVAMAAMAARMADKIVTSSWWIDAICINQDDVLERNQQVTLMTRIYRMAMGVQVWLGAAGDNSDLAMDVIDQYRNATVARSNRGPGKKAIDYPEVSLEQKALQWKALTALFERPWWERCWVRQEVAVSGGATVQCGSKTCDFNGIIDIADVLNILSPQLQNQPLFKSGTSVPATVQPTTSCFLRARQFSDLKDAVGGAKFADLKQLLIYTRPCKATDPRDKVFSVLGMVDPEIYDIQPDYRISIEETFTTAARCIISKKQSLDILSACQNPDRSHGLPSWVINLLDDWKFRPFWVDPHSISSRDEFSGTPYFKFEGDDNAILNVRGRRLDTIFTVVTETPKDADSSEQLNAIFEAWKGAAATEFSRPEINWHNKRYLKTLTGWKKEDRWVNFLSLGNDGGGFNYTEDGLTLLPRQKKTQSIYLREPMVVESIVAPKEPELLDESTAFGSEYERLFDHLRKYGVGRKLGFLANGAAGLVPADTQVNDVLYDFRRTAYPYVLRKLEDGKHVVVGEARKFTSTFHFLVIWLINVDFPRYMISAQAGAFDFPSHYRDDSRAKESEFEEILII